jgi:hypothetical protein
MAFLPGIFGRQAQQQAPAVTPAAAAGGSAGPATQQQAPANPGAAPGAMVGAQSAPAVGGPVNPMDSFADMFKPRQADPKAPRTPTLTDPYLGPLDPAAFKQQVATANFASAIPQDIVQKAMAGDGQAFMDAINMASREAFAASAQLSHGLVEHGARTAADRVSNSMDSRIRNFQIRSQNTSNEALAHPAVAPMLNAVKVQIAQSNPNLSPEAVQQQAEQYFTQMADVLVAPKQQAAAEAAKPAQGDFSYLLT